MIREPAKWVARLRTVRGSGDANLSLLKTEMTAGHGGKAGRFDSLDQVSDPLLFCPPTPFLCLQRAEGIPYVAKDSKYRSPDVLGRFYGPKVGRISLLAT